MCTACTGYFFSLEVLKNSKVSFFSRFHDQKVSRHWLIFTPFGAIDNFDKNNYENLSLSNPNLRPKSYSLGHDELSITASSKILSYLIN